MHGAGIWRSLPWLQWLLLKGFAYVAFLRPQVRPHMHSIARWACVCDCFWLIVDHSRNACVQTRLTSHTAHCCCCCCCCHSGGARCAGGGFASSIRRHRRHDPRRRVRHTVLGPRLLLRPLVGALRALRSIRRPSGVTTARPCCCPFSIAFLGYVLLHGVARSNSHTATVLIQRCNTQLHCSLAYV